MSEEESIMILRKVRDMLTKSEKSYSAVYSHFLTPAEQTFIASDKNISEYVSFDGGYQNAERRLCRISADSYVSDYGSPIRIFSLQSSDKNAEFSHRNVLGSLMSLGIKREMLGDIIIGEDKVLFFCHESSAEYVRLNLNRIGHSPVTVIPADFGDIVIPEKKVRTVNVSSMRLDCICGECFGISRTKAAEIIKQGLVTVNWIISTNTSLEIKVGDRISMRGKGLAEISDISGRSKKGRLFVEIKV